jgi:hypothetical protein
MKGELPKETLERKKSPLAQDPLELQISGKNWSPLPLREKTWIKEMVDIERLETCLKLNNGEALYDNLRPVSLGRWLKSVEMKRGIQ